MIPSLPLVLLLLPTICFGEPVHMALTRRSGRVRTAQDHFLAADRARARYGFPTAAKLHPSRRATSTNFAVVNEEGDSSYFTSIQIGTPAQTFNVILDTGSSDLFVLDTACLGCSDAPLFDSSKSSSFSQQSSNRPTTISYGSGSVQGFIASDTVSMGSFSVSSQTFLVGEDITQDLIDGDGLAVTNAAPFWQALVTKNQLSSPEMAFQLTRSQSTEDEPGGTFTLGGTNSSLFTGDIEFHDLTGSSTPMFWQISLSAVTVQGNSVDISTGNAAFSAIDTGTTAIGGPSDDVSAIWAAVPGASAVRDQGGEGFFQFPCTTSVSVTLSFGGKAWPINPQDMNLGQLEQGSSMCVGAIFDISLGADTDGSTPSWVVGDTFLKNVYSVFRQNPMSVGFAQLASGGAAASGGSSAATKSASLPNDPLPSATAVRSVGAPAGVLISALVSILVSVF
ncbi:aspartic peptidase domain-containing protein [Mycena alexandri]|uniref:Aspartic peptidase domain-containing protein n=1 Tax=Mycena alexandri TaxID=1745969 RepID=A0AAD6XD76_9AGAR|nr:aspartic peptidase domain-containing protein [Mycena alexandri]